MKTAGARDKEPRRVRPWTMPSPAFTGDQSKPIQAGHGKEGYVQLSVSVPREVKTALVVLAVSNKRWLVDEVREALTKHLKGRS